MNEKWEDEKPDASESPKNKASLTLAGTVEKIIPPIDPRDPEKAQIGVQGADHLYREIRVDNRLTNEKGEEVGLQPGSEVDVTIEADEAALRPLKPSVSSSDTGTNDDQEKRP
ncbi:MAG TPA: hypothetical protein VFA90_16300 [Terriglobales bacterium]|nr:hypothetical protein [Terriglobales bacterium]